MKIFLSTLCALILSFFYSGEAAAQTACPIGATAGSAVCGPSPQTSSSGQEDVEAPRATPLGKWESRWGAIAVDEDTADVGTASDLADKSKAKAQALATCSEAGAKRCKVVTTYRNQCVALAWPTVKYKPASTGLGPSIDFASKRSVSNCDENGGECRVVYSACSKPVFLNFNSI
ncbi:DUF4189 domain-containing protein [Xanthomonas arboricola]